MKAKWFGLFLTLVLAVSLLTPAASAKPATTAAPEDLMIGSNSDDAYFPLGHQQRQTKVNALSAKVQMQAKGVETDLSNKFRTDMSAVSGTGKIFTIIAEFGNNIHGSYGGTVGPQHNQIPAPNRAVDNTTIWAPNFTPAYYLNMLFNNTPGAVSMSTYYSAQSTGMYTVDGDVNALKDNNANGRPTNWVQLFYNEARYGADYCGGIVCATTWRFVNESADGWYANQIAAGMTATDVNNYLAQFDTWDRYDIDGDNNYNEPDGYIDHFQAIHAGEGEETGGGAQGTDAIWSHRWYAYYPGNVCPDGDPVGLCGVRIGSSNYYIGDYTVEPENGGVGVFSHEYGHDLGLPDLYDTSGNTGGAENSSGFWTLYSSGSYGASGKPADGIGSKPIDMSAYEKFFLGWADYGVASYNASGQFKLGPAEFANTGMMQQLIVVLPDKNVDSFIGNAYSGTHFYHSGSGNELDNTMTRSVTLPAGTVNFSAKVRYAIETDWDYAYLTVNGTPVHTNLSTATNPNNQNDGEGITGSSNGNWVDLTADLSAYAGQTVTLGFRYWTDLYTAESGFGVDDISVTGNALDDAETDPGWSYNGFILTNGTVSQAFSNYYMVEYRSYTGQYDAGLKTTPYNFGFLNTKENWVEHFPYQEGMLVWYWDLSFEDNNVGDHCLDGRCGGYYLPVDSHPNLMLRPDNNMMWRPRVQSYDSTFSMKATPKICLHINTTYMRCYGPLLGNRLFDDTHSYWVAPNPAINNLGWSSVPLPGFGVKIRVVAQVKPLFGYPYMSLQLNP